MLRPIACCAHSSCGPTVCWLELQYHEKQLMCSTRFCVINGAALNVSARNQPLASVQKLMLFVLYHTVDDHRSCIGMDMQPTSSGDATHATK